MPKVIVNRNAFHDLPGTLELGKAAQGLVVLNDERTHMADIGDVRFTMEDCVVHADGQPIFTMEVLADGTMQITLRNAEIWPKEH